MLDHTIKLPSKPRIVNEDGNRGTYEIDGLYPGYGHTLGNSLRRIILSSLPGAAITSVKIDGVSHEFSVIDGVREDVINIILNLRQVRFQLHTDEPQTVTLSVKGPKQVTAGDIKVSGQVSISNTDQHIAEITDKNTSLSIEMTVEKGLGFVPSEQHQKTKVDIGTIILDASFTPIRRVSYEVENMRVDDNTNYNRLRIIIETDGTITPREALESSIITMIRQLESIVEFKQVVEAKEEAPIVVEEDEATEKVDEKESLEMADIMKTRIDSIGLSTRTLNSLTSANIRTLGGIARKHSDDLLEIEGMGEKGIQEIKKVLANFGITLK
jgi:DNA-directed RNA polymerase subunit alpha